MMPLSNFAFKFDFLHYNKDGDREGEESAETSQVERSRSTGLSLRLTEAYATAGDSLQALGRVLHHGETH
jgi:hypothetical protein